MKIHNTSNFGYGVLNYSYYIWNEFISWVKAPAFSLPLVLMHIHKTLLHFKLIVTCKVTFRNDTLVLELNEV